MASFKDTVIRGTLQATNNIKVGENFVYHDGRKPSPKEIGASQITIGTSKPNYGHWYNELGGYSNITRIQIKPGGELDTNYQKTLHPETDATMVILSNGKNLQSAIDSGEIGGSSASPDILKELQELKNKITTLESKCPYPLEALFYTDSGTNPTAFWPGTTWEKIEDAYIVATGDSFSTTAAIKSGSTSFSLSQNNMPSHSHSGKISAFTTNVTIGGHTHGTPMSITTSGTSTVPSGSSIFFLRRGKYDPNYLADNKYDTLRMYDTSGYGYNIDDVDWYNDLGVGTVTQESSSITSALSFPETNLSINVSGRGQSLEYKPKYRTVHIWKRVS